MLFSKKKSAELSPDSNAGNTENTLSDIVRGIQHAVNTAQEVIEQQYFQHLNKFIDQKKTIKLSDDHFLEVPLITLVSMDHLVLDEMSVDMTLIMNHASKKELRNRDYNQKKSDENQNVYGNSSRSSFSISLAKNRSGGNVRAANEIGIRMKFKAGEPPEAVNKIVEEFTRSIFPKKIIQRSDNADDGRE